VGDCETIKPKKGDLVRWIYDYALYAADDKGNAWPHDPQYEYGVIMEVSHSDPHAIIVFSTTTKMWHVAHMVDDDIEIISESRNKVVIPTAEEIKKYEK